MTVCSYHSCRTNTVCPIEIFKSTFLVFDFETYSGRIPNSSKIHELKGEFSILAYRKNFKIEQVCAFYAGIPLKKTYRNGNIVQYFNTPSEYCTVDLGHVFDLLQERCLHDDFISFHNIHFEEIE